jgi:hypothetical protein
LCTVVDDQLTERHTMKAGERQETESGQDDALGTGSGWVSRANAPVSLRLGDLEGDVLARAGDTGASIATIIKRDLNRYYQLLVECRRRLWFSLPEAEAIVLALGPEVKTPSQYIWAEIERQYLENADDPEFPTYYYLPDDLDAAALVERLRKLGPAEAHAVRDAAETYWANQGEGPVDPSDIDTQRLVDLHLTRPDSVKRDTERRAREKASGQVIARDPAANLRGRRAAGEDE